MLKFADPNEVRKTIRQLCQMYSDHENLGKCCCSVDVAYNSKDCNGKKDPAVAVATVKFRAERLGFALKVEVPFNTLRFASDLSQSEAELYYVLCHLLNVELEYMEVFIEKRKAEEYCLNLVTESVKKSYKEAFTSSNNFV